MEEGEGFGTNFYLFFVKNLLFTNYLVESLFWSTFDSSFPWIVLSASLAPWSSCPLAPFDSHFVMQGFVTCVSVFIPVKCQFYSFKYEQFQVVKSLFPDVMLCKSLAANAVVLFLLIQILISRVLL